MSTPPVIDNAPGIAWRSNRHGYEARWRARPDLIDKGFIPRNVRLWAASAGQKEPSTNDILFIADRCQSLQAEMLAFSNGGIPTNTMFDGTVASLIVCYMNDRDSNYRKLRHCTRVYYKSLCKRLETDCGASQVSDLKARDILRLHGEWKERGVAMAHSAVGMLRTLVNFGATFLENEECERLSGVLSKMRFEMPKARTSHLTAEQAIAIRAKAHEMGWPSIALAQAIQFECMLRQKDVIGEWVPNTDPGPSDITTANVKWLRGLRWQEIDKNLILRHTTSKRQKDIEIDLKLADMVLEEFNKIELQSSGPVVVSEKSGLPWTNQEFRYIWRKIANAAGVPKSVKNMDSRAGAITEATEAGAELEHIKHAATHGDISMTQRYARGAEEKTANVMRLRTAHRNKGGTQ